MESCVWVTWNGPSGGDAFVARSSDGGTTWTRRKVVDSDRYYFAYDGDITSDGTVVLAQSSISYSGPGGAPAGVVKHHALVSDDGGDSWRTSSWMRCASACPASRWLVRPTTTSDTARWRRTTTARLYFAYDGALRPGTRQRTFVSTSDDGGDTWSAPVADLGAARAVGVPDGRGHGVG